MAKSASLKSINKVNPWMLVVIGVLVGAFGYFVYNTYFSEATTGRALCRAGGGKVSTGGICGGGKYDGIQF